MQYKTNNDLPDPVKNHLPEHAQSIYRNAFDNAYDEYQDAKKCYITRRSKLPCGVGSCKSQVRKRFRWQLVY